MSIYLFTPAPVAPSGAKVKVFTDSGCTALATITSVEGLPIPGSVIPSDGQTGALPHFLGPQTSLWLKVQVTGGATVALTATDSGPAANPGGAYAPVSATWQPTTAYKAGQLVTNGGSVYKANADFTSGASFNAANWTAVGSALPSGGTTSQVLKKNSSADGDAGWGDTAALSNTTPLVESGSGSAGTATDASRSDHAHPALAVPAAVGLSGWTLPIARYQSAPNVSTTATSSNALNQAEVFPIVVSAPRSGIVLDRIGIQITTAGAAGAVVRLGIYADNGGVPGSKLLDAGTIDATTTGIKELTISQAIAGGQYWLLGVMQGATSTWRTANLTGFAMSDTVNTNVGSNKFSCYWVGSVSGALPTTLTLGGLDGNAPHIFLRASA